MSLELRHFDDINAAQNADIEAFVDSQNTGHPFQFPQWGDSSCTAAILRIDGHIRWYGIFNVLAPLGRKFPFMRAWGTNRGPVCDDQTLWLEAAEQLANILLHDRVTYLEVSPDWLCTSVDAHSAFSNKPVWGVSGQPRASLRLDLTRDEDEIYGDFRKNSRYEVRRAERSGLQVSVATTDADREGFLELYREMASRKGFSPDPIEHVRRILCWIATAKARGALLVARAEGVLCGGAVIVRAGRRCWYVWGASGPRQSAAGHILQWKALQWAKVLGCVEYDFGGYTPGATSGPAWFKAGFGGTAVHFIPPYRRVIRPEAYRLVHLASKIRRS